MKSIEICFLEDYSDLFTALESVSSITKSQLKKLGLKKKDWELPVKARKEYSFDIDVINYLMINPNFSNDNAKIIEQNDNFVIMSKPFNCHSHPLKYSDSNNMLSFLRSECGGSLLRVNKESYDRGLLFRLDYETSGLLLYCKKDFLYRELREEFATLVEEKVYYAIVQGNFSSRSLTHKIVYTGSKGSKAKAMDVGHEEGITASLDATRIKHNQEEDLTLLRVVLKEGHRHQIRVQLAAEGCPILGDALYGARESKRLFLHCHSYCVKGNMYEDSSMELFDLFFDLNG